MLRRSFLFALLVACKDEPGDTPPIPERGQPASVASVARALGVDASSLEVPVDPPSPAGDLRTDIDRFTTVDACVTEHAQTDPLVGDALRAIGYDTFLRDACRMLEAMKTKSIAKCATIDAGGIRARCEAQVAMVIGSPEACPWEVPETPAQGRQPVCLAVASRDPRLCAGAARADRAACDALVSRNEARCTDDRTRANCKRDVKRWLRVLEPPETGLPPIPPAHAKMTLHGADKTPDPTQIETDLSEDLARGVVVTQAKDGAHVAFGSPRELGLTTFAPPPSGRARLALSIVILPKAASANIEHAEIGVPGATTIVFPGGKCDCRVAVTKMGSARGDEVHVVLDGTASVAEHGYVVKADMATFVRDVVDTSPGASAAGPAGSVKRR